MYSAQHQTLRVTMGVTDSPLAQCFHGYWTLLHVEDAYEVHHTRWETLRVDHFVSLCETGDDRPQGQWQMSAERLVMMQSAIYFSEARHLVTKAFTNVQLQGPAAQIRFTSKLRELMMWRNTSQFDRSRGSLLIRPDLDSNSNGEKPSRRGKTTEIRSWSKKPCNTGGSRPTEASMWF